ncbi:MAG: hypothetical protein ACI9KE_000049, partial [Polyangiales bacterium]
MLGALPTSQLPVILVVSLEIRADFLVGDQNSDRSNLRSMTSSFTFNAAGDETPDLPLPLEFWPVRLFAANDGIVTNTSVGPQSIDVAPWEFFIGPSEVEHQFNLPTIQAEPQEFLLPVAPGLSTLLARGRFGSNDVDFVFNGPGIYALSADGAATFEPPAGVDAGSVDSGAGIDGGTGFDGGISIDAGTPDAGPPPCGSNGQRPCADGTCAENHDLDGDFCFPCGTDGEARCSGESDCAVGNFLVSSICEACGDDGQLACRDLSTRERYCNEGHYYSSNDTSCTICGDDGQIACRDSSTRERYCNEGHYYSSNDTSCTICGDDGQIACRDSSTRERYCNEGHYYSSNDTSCTICGDDGQIAC